MYAKKKKKKLSCSEKIKSDSQKKKKKVFSINGKNIKPIDISSENI